MTRPEFQIIDAKSFHCGRILRVLRKEAKNALLLTVHDGHRDLCTCFDSSSFRKAFLIDGVLAGLGGVMGTEMSSAGLIWLAISQEATRYPRVIVTEAQRQIGAILHTKRLLVATTLPADRTAQRFAAFLGFQEEKEIEDGSRVWTLRRDDDIVVRERQRYVNESVSEMVH